MIANDGSTTMEFDGSLSAEPRRGFAPMIGLALAAASSLLLWAVVALVARWVAHTFL